VVGDAQQLPFADNSVDGYTIAFGLRNVTRIPQALQEAHRVSDSPSPHRVEQRKHPLLFNLRMGAPPSWCPSDSERSKLGERRDFEAQG